MGTRLYGVLYLLFGVILSAFGVWVNTTGLVLTHPELDGVFMLLPASLCLLAAIMCPLTAALLGCSVGICVLDWPPAQAGASFGGWAALLLYWRCTRPYCKARMNLALFLTDARCMVMGLPLHEDEMPTEISPTGGPMPLRLLLPKIVERLFSRKRP